MLSLILTALVLGFTYAAIPGPVNTESIRRTLKHGPKEGIAIQVGSLVGDIFWAIVGLSGAAFLLRFDAVTVVIGLIGAGILLRLAKDALAGAIRPHQVDATGMNGKSLPIGLAFGMANPAGIAFWSGLGASVFGTRDPSLVAIAALVVAFGIGAVTWAVVAVGTSAWGGRRFGDRLNRAVDAISAIVLGWFGVRLAWSSAQKAKPILGPTLRSIF